MPRGFTDAEQAAHDEMNRRAAGPSVQQGPTGVTTVGYSPTAYGGDSGTFHQADPGNDAVGLASFL